MALQDAIFQQLYHAWCRICIRRINNTGVMLGIFLYVAGRLFGRAKLSPKQIIFSTAWVWAAVEICAGIVGLIVWRTEQGVYPEWVYPDDSLGLFITQSIQITAYLTGLLFSIILICYTWHRRKSQR